AGAQRRVPCGLVEGALGAPPALVPERLDAREREGGGMDDRRAHRARGRRVRVHREREDAVGRVPGRGLGSHRILLVTWDRAVGIRGKAGASYRSPMHDPSPSPPSAARRLLFIRPRFLGDICLTLPALDAARAACPGARVAYVVEEESAPLLAGDPRVEELVVVPRAPGPAATLALVRRLRRFAPDVAFDLFCNPRT